MVITLDEKTLITNIAQILITELKLQDITAEKFDPDFDLVDDVGAFHKGAVKGEAVMA